MTPSPKRWILGVLAACAATSCGDYVSTEPQVVAPAPATFASSAPNDVVKLLKRTEALRGSITASAVIGPHGGRIDIEEAGVSIVFPRGALRKRTRITATALRGRNVAYRFGPHGTVFERPVIVHQSLRRTTAWKNPALMAELQASYFDRLLVDQTESYARTREHRRGSMREAGNGFEFAIEHFSGYIVSVGKGGIDIDIGIDITSR